MAAGCAFACSVLDCLLPFIMWKSRHGVQGKAKLSSTSSHSHKFESYKSCHWAEPPGPPSLPFPSHGDCPGTRACCGKPRLPACKQVQGCYAQFALNPKTCCTRRVERGLVLPRVPAWGAPGCVWCCCGSAPQTRRVGSRLRCALAQPTCPQTSLQKNEPKEQVSLLIAFLDVELQL